jgi:hypothetical protein
MYQHLLTEYREKTLHRIAPRKTRPTSAQSFHRGAHPIHQLQRLLGNRRVAQLIQDKQLTPEAKIISLRRKLIVGTADGQYEQEADHVARRMMNIPDAVVANLMQRAIHTVQHQDGPLMAPALVPHRFPDHSAVHLDHFVGSGPMSNVAKQTAEPATPERVGPAAPRKRAVGDLDARVGNRRVALTMRGAPAIQRDAKFGMMKKEQVTAFAGLALKFWRENPDKTLAEFGTHLMEKLNVQLAANGVPKLPAPNLSSHRAAGGFAASSWTVEFDLARTATRPLTTKIKELPADRISELAGICYHEARHAEQVFLVARLVASEVKDAKAVATALDIPLPIAEAALKATGPLPGGKEGLEKIRGWRAFHKGGEHQDYQDWNESLRQFVSNVIKSLPSPLPEGVDGITAALGKLSPVLAGWRKDTLPFADDKITKLKGAKTRDAIDNQVLGDLTATRRTLKKVMNAETETIKQLGRLKARQKALAKKNKKMTVDEAKLFQLEIAVAWLGLNRALAELDVVTGNAYRSYAHEADAYAAQRAVMKEITVNIATPSGKH